VYNYSEVALFSPGDSIPKTGFYQCIFCRQVVLCTKGGLFPACKSGCRKPAYGFVRKDRSSMVETKTEEA
jgi:hypothetical protein